ncbi:MAG: primosomal protein N' [Actinomycetia bacterium]|nr:primosomal protein N' [Actinomycetes bacterium]
MEPGHKYAEVYIDIRSLSVDHPFDYMIPPEMLDSIRTGSVVIVPVSNRKEIGYVVRVKDKSAVPAGALKEIAGLAPVSPVFDAQTLKLAMWMSKYYIQPLTSVLRLFLPPGRKNKRALQKKGQGYKYRTMIEIDKSAYGKVINDPEWKRSKAQKRILDMLDRRDSGTMEKAILLKDSSSGSIKKLIEKGLVKQNKQRVRRDFRYGSLPGGSGTDIILNQYQRKCIDLVENSLKKGESRKFLVQGVTGSGKTEIYMNICKKVILSDRRALILVPEISLTPQLFSRFEKMFGREVAVYHSHMSDGERYDKWMEILEGEVRLVIGTRSALFTPIKDIGIIIIDEEHDPSYKEGSMVRYNTRDVAARLSEIKNIPLLMGSATPSVTTRYMVDNRKDYTLLRVPVRARSSKKVKRQVVDLRTIDRKKEDEFITPALHKAIREELEKDNKVIIFINRRGFSNFVVCTGCGNVPECPACELSYNYHRDSGKLICHHCGREEKYTGVCRQCQTANLFLAGSGIQRVEEKIRARFGDGPIYRMDSDITKKKKSHQDIIGGFSAPGRAMMIGTQMIAKGLDIEDVTLVGVINCDGMFSLPDYHMNERAYQLITQVAGRAGRKDKEGRVIIQTYRPDAGVIAHLMDEDYEKFYREELESRRELSYPPFSNLVNIIISGHNALAVKDEAKKLLDKINKDIKINTDILGPAQAPFYKINKFYRWHILLKTKEIDSLTRELGELLKSYRKNKDIRLIIDIDPEWIL